MSKYGAYDFPSQSFLCEFKDGHYIEKLFDTMEEAKEYFAEDVSDTCVVSAHAGDVAKIFEQEPQPVIELKPKKKKDNVSLFLLEE